MNLISVIGFLFRRRPVRGMQNRAVLVADPLPPEIRARLLRKIVTQLNMRKTQ